MGRLRHLYLPEEVTNLGKSKLRFDGLSKLETLENFDPSWCEVNDLPKLNNLRKLTLVVQSKLLYLEEIMIYLASSGIASSYIRYLSLSIFHCNIHLGNGPSVFRQLFSDCCNLNRLTIFGPVRELPVFDNSTPDNLSSSLTTLIMGRSRLTEDPMKVLEKIPTLRKLSLLIDVFMGKEMIGSSTGFPQLTMLSLFFVYDSEKLKVDEGGMPKLSSLEIDSCSNLKEVPEGLKFLNNLSELKLLGMTALSNRVRVVNGEQGADFYKVAHVPSILIDKFSDN